MDKLPTVFIIPFMSPSANHIYVSGRGGKRFLSKEASAFKSKAIALLSSKYVVDINSLNKDSIYCVWYNFFMDKDKVINKTFGSNKKDSALTRYKKMDVDNRVKLVSDAFASAIGIDDSQFFSVGSSKMNAATLSGPQIHIYLTEASLQGYGF